MADNSVFEIDASGKVWRNIPGYVGVYVLSEFGEVKRIRPGVGRARVGAILCTGKNPKGYKHLLLSRNGRSKTFYIHTLVCRVFHGPKPTPAHQAAHRDDDKENNHQSNLYWATPKQNHADRRRNGGILVGERIGRSKLTERDVRRIRELRRMGWKNACIGKKFGVAPHTISAINTGLTWGHVV